MLVFTNAEQNLNSVVHFEQSLLKDVRLKKYFNLSFLRHLTFDILLLLIFCISFFLFAAEHW